MPDTFRLIDKGSCALVPDTLRLIDKGSCALVPYTLRLIDRGSCALVPDTLRLIDRHPKFNMYSSSEDNRMLMFLPMYHSFGLILLLTSLFHGVTVISMRKYEMTLFIEHIRNYQVCAVYTYSVECVNVF